MLSSTGVAFRRCALAWINGEQIGANFLTGAGKPKQDGRAKRVPAHDVRREGRRCTDGIGD